MYVAPPWCSGLHAWLRIHGPKFVPNWAVGALPTQLFPHPQGWGTNGHRDTLKVPVYIYFHMYVLTFQMPRSRSGSGSSRGECKDCSRKKESWKGHLCLRHSPCLHPAQALWNPDECLQCSELLATSARKNSPEAFSARTIIKEILRGAEAAATRRDLQGFVTEEIFMARFEPWMGSLYNKKVVRKGTKESSSRPTSREAPRTPRSKSSPASRKSLPSPQERSRGNEQEPHPPVARTNSPSPGRHRAKRPLSRSPEPRERQKKRELSPSTIQETIDHLLALQQSQAGSPARRSRSRERSKRPRNLSASPDRSPATPCLLRSLSSSSSEEEDEEEQRDPSPHRRDLFGTDSDSSRPPTPAPEEDLVLPAPLASPAREGPDDGEDLREGKYFYFLTSEASIKDGNLHLPELPPVPASNLILTREQDRQVVAFRDPTLDPALDYIERLPRVGMKKDSSPSQRELVYKLNKIIHASGEQANQMSWKVKNVQAHDSPFEVAEAPQLESFANRLRQPKGFGDESRRLPTTPNVPLCSSGENFQGLLDFLEAPPLSPTSHKISKVYTDRRTTIEPLKADRDLDSEYRRAGRTATALKVAWEFMEEVAVQDDLKPLARLKIMRSVLKAFKKDLDANMDYQVTRAVHHRRNLIQFSTRQMPQEDIRLAIQDLPLPRGPTLFHESAAERVTETLLRPEGRELKAIPPKPFQQRAFSRPAPQNHPTPSTSRHNLPNNASGRQRTRPAHPKAPPRRSASSGPPRGRSAPSEWKRPKSSTTKPGPSVSKKAPPTKH